MGGGDRLSGNERHLAALQAIDESAQLLTAFSGTSVIGFAVCDDQLRYQGINAAMAAMNGITAEAHVGKTVRDILKGAASKPEPALRQVLASGQAVRFELAAMLPTRTELGYWIENYLPIKGRQGRRNLVATITVEVTAQRKLERAFRKVAGDLLWRGNKQDRWLATDLHDSINEYHEAVTSSLAQLTVSLASLNEHSWEPEESGGILMQSVEWLDRRIANMRTVISDVATHFADQSSTAVSVM
jgi:transcriptional regulator with PAS, ATPase and Fis domain